MPIIRASQSQLEANRLNAQKSTGPQTEAGKAVSSRNSLTHGLTAQQVVLAVEDPNQFEALRDKLHEEFDPCGPTEEHLVEQLAVIIVASAACARVRGRALRPGGSFLRRRLIGPMLGKNLAADPPAGSTADTSEGQVRERFLIGRVIGVLMNKNDLLNKLGRHEAHLMRQVEKTLAQLRALKAERPAAIAENPQQPAAGYVELDGWGGLLAPPLEEN